MSQPSITPKKWKRTAIGASVACFIFIGLFACTLYLARLSLSDHRNLYYTLWKAGLREYDWTVAKGGMLHDHEFRESLRGLTIKEFEKRFPITFYEMQTPPPNAKEDRSYFVDNYFASQAGGHQYGFVWVVVFEKGKLLEFGNDKGI